MISSDSDTVDLDTVGVESVSCKSENGPMSESLTKTTRETFRVSTGEGRYQFEMVSKSEDSGVCKKNESGQEGNVVDGPSAAKSTCRTPVYGTSSSGLLVSMGSSQNFPMLKCLLKRNSRAVEIENIPASQTVVTSVTNKSKIHKRKRTSVHVKRITRQSNKKLPSKTSKFKRSSHKTVRSRADCLSNLPDHDDASDIAVSLGVLQVNTATLPAWALQIFSKAKSVFFQPKDRLNNLPESVRLAVEVFKSSQWEPSSSSIEADKHESSDRDTESKLTDLVVSVDGFSDVADGEAGRVGSTWDQDWLSPTVFEDDSSITASHAMGSPVASSQTADGADTTHGSQGRTSVQFICRLCKKVCSSRGVLKRHMIEKHSQQKSTLQFKCKICGSAYKRNYCLVEHMRVHTGEKSVSCTECDARFRYRSDMRKHYRHKHGGRKYLCKVCGRSFLSDRGFKYHMGTHEETSPIMCDRCGRAFRSKLALKRHREYTHKEEYESKIMCEMCSEMFPSETALHRHQRTSKFGPCRSLRPGRKGCGQQNSESFITVNCSQCGAGFSSDQHLKKHMEFHSGTRPYLCSECNMAFSRKDHFNTHCRSHKLGKDHASKTFDCQVCGVGMKTENQLEMHMGFHTGSRPFQCNICWLAFAKKDRLETHSQSHNANRVRYPCGTCGASFCTKALLRYHCVLRHAAETPHVCNVCGERFDRKCHLQQHMKGPCRMKAHLDRPVIVANADLSHSVD